MGRGGAVGCWGGSERAVKADVVWFSRADFHEPQDQFELLITAEHSTLEMRTLA